MQTVDVNAIVKSAMDMSRVLNVDMLEAKAQAVGDEALFAEGSDVQVMIRKAFCACMYVFFLQVWEC